MKVVAAIAKAMKREGVEFLIGYPVNPIIEAAAEADIRTIIVRQERTGLHMADAVAAVTSGDKIGVFCMQHGPGHRERLRRRRPGLRRFGADRRPAGRLPAPPRQRPAQLQLVPRTSARHQVGRAGHRRGRDVPDAHAPRLHPGCATAARGPALVEIPADVMARGGRRAARLHAGSTPRSGPDPADVARGRRGCWSSAERPVIYAGQGVHYAQAWDAAAGAGRAARERRSPPASRARAPSPRTIRCRSAAAAARSPSRSSTSSTDADVIFGIGCSFAPTSFGVRDAAPGKTIIHATLDPADLNKDMPSELRPDRRRRSSTLTRADRRGDGRPRQGQPRGRAAGVAAEIADAPRRLARGVDAEADLDDAPITPTA